MSEAKKEQAADKELNLKNEVCPYTFVKSKLAIEGMEIGQVLRVVVDYLPSTKNVPSSMENEGHEILDVSQINESDWQIVIRKGE